MTLKNWIMLIFLSMLWGGSFFLIEVALLDFSPFQLVFLRLSIAAVALTLFVYIRGRRLSTDLVVWRNYFVMGLINNAIPFSLIAWGQTQISAGEASILNAMTPIFTVLLAHVFTQDERLSKNKIVGVCIGFSGVFVMMLPSMDGGLTLQGYGQLAVIFAAILYGLSSIWGKKMSAQTPNANAAGMLICSSLTLLPLVLLFESDFPMSPSYPGVLSILSISVVSTALAYILYFKILGSSGATNLSLVTLLVPVGAIFLEATILAEHIGFVHIIGMVCIFIGLICIDGRLLKRIKA